MLVAELADIEVSFMRMFIIVRDGGTWKAESYGIHKRTYMIPVPFPYEPDAQQKFVEMRRQAMAHLKEGGLITLRTSPPTIPSTTWTSGFRW